MIVILRWLRAIVGLAVRASFWAGVRLQFVAIRLVRLQELLTKEIARRDAA